MKWRPRAFSRFSTGDSDIPSSCDLETGVLVNLWSFLKGVKPLVMYDLITEWLWSQCKGNCPHLNLIWGTPSYFAFLRWHRCPSRLVTVILGTLWGSVKQIEAPYVFHWENGIVLNAMHGNQASSRGKWEVSWVFLSWGRNLWYIIEYGGDVHSKLEFVQRCQDTCLVMTDTSGM